MSIHPASRALLLAVAVAAPAGARQASLFEDLNTTPVAPFTNSDAGEFSPAPGGLVFTARTSLQNLELWVSDGTPAGTSALFEFVPGLLGGLPSELTRLDDGRYAFAAQTVDRGRELWITDGTVAGTALVADVVPGPLGSGPTLLTAAAGGLYFFADDGVHGRELWWSDLTPAGTTLAVDATPGPDSTQPRFVVARPGGDLVFGAVQPVTGSTVWISDGTPGGSSLLQDLPSPFGTATTAAFVPSTGRVVWNVPTLDGGLWSTDGTAGGTTAIVAPPGAFFDSYPTLVTAAGGWAYYTASDPNGVERLMRTDGTLANTGPAGSVDPASQALTFSFPTELTAVGGKLAFSALSIPNDGVEPWIHDPTTGLSRLLADVAPNSEWSSPREFTEVGDRIYFSAGRADVGRELWSVGDSPATLELAADLLPGAASSSPLGLTPYAGGLVFAATAPVVGQEPFLVPQAGSTPSLLADIANLPLNEGSDPTGLVRLGRTLLTGATGTAGDPNRDLWSSDGGPFEFVAAFAASFGGGPDSFRRLGDRVVFVHDSPTLGKEPWTTDGTGGGTEILADLAPQGIFGQAAGSFPRFLTTWRGELYFTAENDAVGRELLATDGTPTGTRLVAEIVPGPGDPDFDILGTAVTLDDGVYFAARGPNGNGSELWKTDGTAAGTVLAVDISPGATGSAPEELFSDGSLIYFSAWTPGTGREPWRSDGTPGGTSQLAELNLTGDSDPGGFVRFGDRVLFAAEPVPSRRDLYAADASGAVTNLTGSIPHFAENKVSQTLGRTGNGVVFRTDGLAGNSYYWVSDGTTAGTKPLALLDPDQLGLGFSTLVSLSSYDGVPIGDALLFRGFTAEHGSELWITDGSVAGTTLVADVEPGPLTGGAFAMTRLADLVFYVAGTITGGQEFWSVPVSALGVWDALEIGGGCAGSAGYPPTIGFGGSAGLGDTLDVELGDAPPGAAAALYLAGGWSETDLGPCRIYLATLDWSVPLVADGAGEATTSIAVPSLPPLAGLEVWLQYAVIDPGGEVAGSASTTPALEVLIGP